MPPGCPTRHPNLYKPLVYTVPASERPDTVNPTFTGGQAASQVGYAISRVLKVKDLELFRAWER